MKPTVYIETSIPSYLTARPSTDIRAAGWQQLTYQWWEDERPKYDIFISELVIAEASQGHPDAAQRRLKSLENIPELAIDQEIGELASSIMVGGGIPVSSEADALHVAVAAVHRMDYLLTWNCRHINNASTKPIIRKLCEKSGLFCPEICTPLELMSEE
jgi:hypothetical protein